MPVYNLAQIEQGYESEIITISDSGAYAGEAATFSLFGRNSDGTPKFSIAIRSLRIYQI
jgi:hypothetical protein